MAYIKIDNTNRITAASYNFHCGDGEIEVVIPEDIQLENIHDYLYINGDYAYDPLPKPEPIEPEPAGEEVTTDDMAAAIMEGVNAV